MSVLFHFYRNKTPLLSAARVLISPMVSNTLSNLSRSGKTTENQQVGPGLKIGEPGNITEKQRVGPGLKIGKPGNITEKQRVEPGLKIGNPGNITEKQRVGPELKISEPGKMTENRSRNQRAPVAEKKMDNLCAVLYGINDLRMEQKPIEDPDDHEVLLEMHCVGICGSDVHYLTHGQIGDFRLSDPMIVGHEASGIVSKVGAKVKHLKVGDRVAIEPGVPCRTCTYCKEGRYNLCRQIFFCATPPDHGNLSRYYRHAADFCHKLPDHVSLEEGALLEPLSVGVHACRRAGVTLGSKVLITGAGPIGLVTLLTARALGASRVVITDILEHKLKTAKEMGADATVLIDRNHSLEEISAHIIELLQGEQPDKTIDCSGIESTIKLGMLATRPGGCLVIVGAGSQDVKIPLVLTMTKEIDIRGVFRYANDYPIALAMVASGKVDVKKLITHNYLLEDTLHAFETAKTGAGNAIKVMIHCKEGLDLKNNSKLDHQQHGQPLQHG